MAKDMTMMMTTTISNNNNNKNQQQLPLNGKKWTGSEWAVVKPMAADKLGSSCPDDDIEMTSDVCDIPNGDNTSSEPDCGWCESPAQTAVKLRARCLQSLDGLIELVPELFEVIAVRSELRLRYCGPYGPLLPPLLPPLELLESSCITLDGLFVVLCFEPILKSSNANVCMVTMMVKIDVDHQIVNRIQMSHVTIIIT